MIIRRTPMNRVFDRWFEEMTRDLAGVEEQTAANFSLALDVAENDNQYTVTTALPGVKADDIDIRLHDSVLTITAEINNRHQEENGNTLIQELRYGKFSRSLRFPTDVNSEAVEADYNDGILTLTVPKAEAAQPRTIRVKHNGSQN